ncbi:T-cell surface glycoprotein CD3 epsilon chain-like [Cynoglossus semilaevis]|uniref:T-cell surface glycoprotein CD3 epsilon chain-like n=1 Tax=Cynoglossus semilaevis TaxID=244447 RepID=A0A3P8US33_CYNSE|nr:T-cell surface glycoprotein CD3 epsilon chain-like [Cynoglossus semilaevis]
MNAMGVWPRIVVLFLVVATVRANEKGTVISDGNKFIMNCPAEGDWYMNEKKLNGDKTRSLEKEYGSDTKGLYSCKYTEDGTEKTYFFYIKGKPCANCWELDGLFLLTAIVAEVLGTVVFMTIIYKCTKKKSSGGPDKTPQKPSRPGGRAPQATSSDYEQLNRTRASDPYAFVNRMG